MAWSLWGLADISEPLCFFIFLLDLLSLDLDFISRFSLSDGRCRRRCSLEFTAITVWFGVAASCEVIRHLCLPPEAPHSSVPAPTSERAPWDLPPSLPLASLLPLERDIIDSFPLYSAHSLLDDDCGLPHNPILCAPSLEVRLSAWLKICRSTSS